MALFQKSTPTPADNNSVPADLQQYYNAGPSGVGRWALRIVLFLAVLALLVWGGIWLFNKLTNDDDTATNKPAPATSQQSDAEQKAAQARAQAEADAKKAAEDARNQAAADAKKAEEEAKRKAAATAPAAGTLPNSGPETGLAAMVFVATTAVAAGAHAAYTRRQVR